MSKTDESTHNFTVVMFLHPQVLYISFFSFITNIYKDNYVSLNINEQFKYIGARNAEACIKLVVLRLWLGSHTDEPRI